MEKYEETKVLVRWLAGYDGAQPSVIQTAQVDKNDVSEGSDGSITISVTNPDNPVRTGYDFNGWSDPERESDGSIVITAQWTEKHVHKYTQTKDPTCEEKGEETCTCGDKREINALGHDWGTWKDNGDGTHSQVCKRDENHVNTEKENHKYPDEWIITKQPTETEPGEKEHSCTDCGHKETEEIPATGKPDEPKKEYTVTWVDENGKPIGEPKKTDDPTKIPEGPAVPTPPEGKVFDKWGDPEVNEDDKTITIQVVWKNKTVTPVDPTPATYRLRIEYVYEDGSEAAKTVTKWLERGERYSVASPELEGYTASEAVVAGAMGGRSTTVTVIYTAKEVEAPTEPEDPTVPEEPAENPEEPGEDLEDPDVPLGENPEEPGEDLEDPDVPLGENPDVPENPEEPGEDLEDPDVPLGENPDVPENPEDLGDEPDVPENPEDLGDEPDVPLADVPQTGEASTVLWMAAVLAAGAGLVALNTGKRKEDAQ